MTGVSRGRACILQLVVIASTSRNVFEECLVAQRRRKNVAGGSFVFKKKNNRGRRRCISGQDYLIVVSS